MKSTLTVLFVLAMLVSSTQTFRHVYVKWIEPQGSVLDEFKDDTESNIAQAKDLAELTELYRVAYQDVKKAESDPSNPKINYSRNTIPEPYRSEQKIKREILAREHDNEQLFKLVLYWVCGLCSLFAGIVTFTRINRWLGISGIIIGFSEMLCWTSPLFHNSLRSQQFEFLLNYKLAFSTITWILLVALWLLVEKRMVPHENASPR